MTQQNNKQEKPSVTFYGKMLTFSRVQLDTDDLEVIKEQLAVVSPTKDSLIPIIIESSVPQKLEELLSLFWDWGLQPIGVVKGLLDEQAKELKIALFPADGKRIQRIKPNAKKAKALKADQKTDEKAAAEEDKSASDNSVNDENNANTSDCAVDNVNNDASDSNQATASEATSSDSKTVESLTDESEANLAKDSAAKDTDNSTDNAADKDADAANTEKAPTETAGKHYLNNDSQSDIDEAYDDDVIDQITSLVYDKILRSGQSINHVGGDLILTSTVNNGSEAITDNNLHIYGKGLGRLVAGATGDKDAHIFCQQFNPTLVSVAGTYCLRDNIPEEFIDKPVHVSYQEGQGLIYRIMEH